VSISPDSSTVVYCAQQETDGVYELYSVPIGGGTPVKLSGGMSLTRFSNTCEQHEISPDGTMVVFVADPDVWPPGSGELYSVPITGGTPTRISADSAGGWNAEVEDFKITADSSRVVYRANQYIQLVYELFSVPIAGGTSTRLNPDLVSGGDVRTPYEISADSARVVYVADQDVDEVFDLYGVGIDGGAAVKLNGATPVGLYPSFSISPDNLRVVYLAEETATETWDLYKVTLAGSKRVKLNGALPTGGEVASFDLIPDGSTVVYVANQDAADALDLYSVAIVGGPSTKLSGTQGAEGSVSHVMLTPDGASVVYQGDEDPTAGREIYVVPVTGGSSLMLGSGLDDAWPAVLTGDGATLVFRSDHAKPGVLELWAVNLEPDPDSDGILEFCDTCPGLNDPGQTDDDSDGSGAACDCDDTDPLRYPEAVEVCDGVDNDCDSVLPDAENDDDGDLYAECAPWTGSGGLLGGGDCDDTDGSIHPGAAEVNDGQDNQCPGDAGYGVADEISGNSGFHTAGDTTEYSWPAQPGATMYEVARAESGDFSVGCTTSQTTNTYWIDVAGPGSGGCFYYLIRPVAPFAGSWGVDSAGVERTGICP
jgi:Tol biopolymer transport system component